MSLSFTAPATAGKTALQRFGDSSPARAALAEEAMGSLLIAEAVSGIPYSRSRNMVTRRSAGGVVGGSFMIVFGAIWLFATSVMWRSSGSIHGAFNVGVIFRIFPLIGLGVLLGGLWSVIRGLITLRAGAAMLRAGRAGQQQYPPTEADREGLEAAVSSAWMQTRWPDGRQVMLQPMPVVVMRMFGIPAAPLLYVPPAQGQPWQAAPVAPVAPSGSPYGSAANPYPATAAPQPGWTPPPASAPGREWRAFGEVTGSAAEPDGVVAEDPSIAPRAQWENYDAPGGQARS